LIKKGTPKFFHAISTGRKKIGTKIIQ